MNSTRYRIFKLARKIGYRPKIKWMGAVASEVYLLHEAEAYLGHFVWQEAEDIEALSTDYWRSWGLCGEQADLRNQLRLKQEQMAQAQEFHADLFYEEPQAFPELEGQKAEESAQHRQAELERDEIFCKARGVKRTYHGLKLKKVVLLQENKDTEDITKSLKILAADFPELKRCRQKIGKQIAGLKQKIGFLNHQIEAQLPEQRAVAAKSSKGLGETIRVVSQLKNEISGLDSEIRKLHAEIGQYINQNMQYSSLCRRAVHGQKRLTMIIVELRKSIWFNHCLANS